MQAVKIAQAQADTLGVRLERLELLDKFLLRLVDEDRHSFIGLRALCHGQTIFSGDYGVQRPGGGPLLPDAIYPMQSITKSITATCAGILQEDGLLDFYDLAVKHFPEFTGGGKDSVEIWQLLCHTSGVDDDVAGEYAHELAGMAKDYSNWIPALMSVRKKLGMPDAEPGDEAAQEAWDLLRLQAPLAAKPGTQFIYSGFNYDLLAKLIERASGQTLEQFSHERIFCPLGMIDSHFALPPEKRARVVLRRDTAKGGEWMNSESMMNNMSPGGGLKATLDDIARFGQMWLQMGTVNGVRVLSPASVRTMTRDYNAHLPDGAWKGRYLGCNWGLGWDVKGDKIDDHGFVRSERSYNHSGYGGATLLIEPDDDLVVAIYLVEEHEESYGDYGPAINILYSALD